MKWLISVFLIFVALNGEAQKINKVEIQDMNQDQLNLALTKSKKTIKTGAILTFAGPVVTAIGGLIAISGRNGDILNENRAKPGAFMIIIGGATMVTGITVWIVGASKKHKIELELVKFNPPGLASINGIGLTVRF
jgi:hypothetical protein